MLVILMEEQILTPAQVCQSCLLADHTGQPRWCGSKLACAQTVGQVSNQEATQYKCVMGFRIAYVE